MELIEQAQQDERREEPVASPGYDATKQAEEEEHHQGWHQIGVPNILTICPGHNGCYIEQRDNDRGKPSIILPSEEIGKKDRRDIEERDQDFTTYRVCAKGC